jgi:ATP-dependent DNA ligase
MIKNILDRLAATPARTEKEAIIRSEFNNETLKSVFNAALDPYLNFGIKKIPEFELNHTGPWNRLEDEIENLKKMYGSGITGNRAKNFISTMLSQLHPDDAEVIVMIIGRDLRCGISDKTLNKIWPNLIPTIDFMLADTDISRIKWPAYCQWKVDGLRINMSMKNKRLEIMSRGGRHVLDHGVMYNVASAFIKDGETFDGEIIFVEDDDSIMPRQKGNGLANKAIRSTITLQEADKMRFVVWDIVDKSSTIPYSERLKTLTDRFTHSNVQFIENQKKFILIDTAVVGSEAEVQEIFMKQIAMGNEGVVVKNLNHVWKPTRSKDQVKIKEFKECDLIVIGTEFGTGRNLNRLGNLICETRDGKLKVSVGSGFSDEQRENKENYFGAIVTVKYNSIIRDNNHEKYSLFLPTFVEVRLDKDQADFLEDMK